MYREIVCCEREFVRLPGTLTSRRPVDPHTQGPAARALARWSGVLEAWRGWKSLESRVRAVRTAFCVSWSLRPIMLQE